mgnify:CR=1 FL=1
MNCRHATTPWWPSAIGWWSVPHDLPDAFILGFAAGAALMVLLIGLYRCTVGQIERGM